jgi:hypothetical protein
MWRSGGIPVWRKSCLLRVNDLAVRNTKARREKIKKLLQSLAETPASKEAGYSRTRRHPQTL